jgi:uncharacterized protein (DUF433 family)
MFAETAIYSPLIEDKNGVIRIGTTRVTLLSVINAYHQGASAEEIVQDFPTLTLAEVYATLAWYLQHRAETDSYLSELRRQAEQKRAEHDMTDIRRRLEARVSGSDSEK